MIALLTASLVRPLVLAAAAWLLLRALRVRHPASQHAVWTAVLIGMLLLPFVSAIAPQWKVPVIPAKQILAVQILPAQPDIPPGLGTHSQPSLQRGFEWPTVETLIQWCYFAGLLSMMIYRGAGWMLLRRVLSRSRPVRARYIRESADVLTPVAVGVLRPIVILPTGWRDWTAKKRRVILAHEFAHLRRHDALVSALARAAQCPFWFHPLAWWITRKIANLAELSCDAAALQKTNDPAGYSRILLEFAEAVNRAGRRVTLPGLAMAAGTGMDRRIDHVFELSGGTLRKLARPGLVLALVGLPVMALVATLGLGSAVAQEPAVPTPKIEVASIKPCNGDNYGGGGRGGRNGSPGIAGGGYGRYSPGRLDIDCATVQGLVTQAYVIFADGRRHPIWTVVSTLVEGGPSWVKSDHYDIHVKAEGTPSEAMMRGPILQALLAERFQLKMAHKTREIPVYELRVARGGHRLKPFQEGSCRPIDFTNIEGIDAQGCRALTTERGPNLLKEARGMDLEGFAKFMLWGLDRPVVDKTGLTGRFDIDLEHAPDDAADGAGPSIFSAIKQQLGLELVAAKGTSEYLVIDRVEKPSEN